MSDTQADQARKLAARNLVPEFESIIRLCRGLTITRAGNPTIPNLIGSVDQIIHKCSPIVHIITIGSTEKRKALATNRRTFTEEWPLHRYKIAGDVLEHCLPLQRSIAEGA